MASFATSKEDVKVVLIDTQYVEADPHSFKSVVQRLTGKDSCVSWIEESKFSGERKGAVKGNSANHRRSCTGAALGGDGDGHGHGVSKLSTNLSFRDLDLDWMILEAPSMDEFKWLWAK